MARHRNQQSTQPATQHAPAPEPGIPRATGSGRHQARAAQRLPQRPAQRAAQRPVFTLEWIGEEYTRDLRRSQLSEKTIRDYRKVLGLAIRCWQEQLGRPPTLEDFTVRNGEAFLDALRQRGRLTRWHGELDAVTSKPLAVETIRTYVRALKAFASWLAAPKQGYTTENRLALLTLPRKPRTYKLPLDKAEMQALVAACDPTSVLGARDLAMLLLLLDGGLRAGELCALRVGHVRLEEGQLFIADGKGRKSRTVTVGSDTKRLLARYAFFRDAEDGRVAAADTAFFRNLQGDPMQYETLRKWFSRLKQRAGVPRAFPHLLRHTSAVRTLEVPGSDLVTLQEKLGHSDIATTRRYVHMANETLSLRQRSFSPVDHLNLDGLMRLAPPQQSDGRLYHRRKGDVAPPPRPRGRPRKEQPEHPEHPERDV